MIRLPVFLLTLMLAVLACGGPQTAPDPGPDLGPEAREIAHAWAAYRDVLTQGDAVGLARLFTPDGVLMEPARPDVEGRDAIQELAAETFSQARILGIDTRSHELRVEGDEAFELGTFSEVVEIEGRPPLETRGRYAAFWRRAGGEWKIHRLMISPLPIR